MTAVVAVIVTEGDWTTDSNLVKLWQVRCQDMMTPGNIQNTKRRYIQKKVTQSNWDRGTGNILDIGIVSSPDIVVRNIR